MYIITATIQSSATYQHQSKQKVELETTLAKRPRNE
jgi:hypothetical protein